jgi:sugar phosphate isomerase/epimerase
VRFGIMAMQLESLLPPDVSAEQAVAHMTRFDQAAVVGGLAHVGFNPIELNGDLALFATNAFNPDQIERLRDLRVQRGISYTVHLPLWSVEPSTPQPPVRRGSVEALINTIRATLPLEPDVYVLHATGALAAEFYRMKLPQLARELVLRQFQANAGESIQTILAETGIPSRKLAVETIEFPLDLTVALAEEHDLSICLDTGHILAGFSGQFEFFEALELCLPRLAEIHLHDAPWYESTGQIGYGTDHRALGDGDLDVARLLDRLTDSHFDGPVIFELSVADALKSLELIRRVRPQTIDHRP